MLDNSFQKMTTNLPNPDMPPSDFRLHGQGLIDWIAAYLADPRQYPVTPQTNPGDLTNDLPRTAPATSESMETILQDFHGLILPRLTHWNHPRFFAYFSISSSAPAILAELLTAALDVNGMLWKTCPAATELEQVTARWVLDWLGLPTNWFGMIVDTASTAIIQPIVAARECAAAPIDRLIAYVSEQTHSSVEKAARAAGIDRENIRHIEVDDMFRMNPSALIKAIREDIALNLHPFFVAATVGTTSTTAIDPIPEIAKVCRDYNLWLHVDGAYGGAFGLLPECRHFLQGVEQADSFIVNPHKQLMVPIDCSLLYTRHPEKLRAAFSLQPEYLKTGVTGAIDYMDYGLALGRRFRSLKLWFTMRYFGHDGIAAILRNSREMAGWLADQISADDRFELAAPVTMGLVCFRLRDGDTRNLMHRLNAAGFYVSHTVLHKKSRSASPSATCAPPGKTSKPSGRQFPINLSSEKVAQVPDLRIRAKARSLIN